LTEFRSDSRSQKSGFLTQEWEETVFHTKEDGVLLVSLWYDPNCPQSLEVLPAVEEVRKSCKFSISLRGIWGGGGGGANYSRGG